MIHTTAKVPVRTNRNLPTRNTLVQLLALYTDPQSHNAQRYEQKRYGNALVILFCYSLASWTTELWSVTLDGHAWV